MAHSVGTSSDLNWTVEDYFEHLLKPNGEEFSYALELMVDDLHKKKEKTINRFMCHQKVDSFLFALLRLLNNDNLRVAGNTAYILGCLAESQLGCYRLLSTVTSNKNFKVLHALVKMLTVSDGETVMNAAGTIGTLAESKEGREWILGEDCLSDLIELCSGLLACENPWTGSNAALVLARLSISEQGRARLSSHVGSAALIGRLCRALGSDDAGRGMNAAFALGRLVDAPQGAELLAGQAVGELDRLVPALAGMTSAGDQGAAKNACFCVSCLAGSEFGHRLVLGGASEAQMAAAAVLMDGLGRLVTGPDEETAWFAALAIRILSSKPRGAKYLRSHPQLIATLRSVVSNPDASPDLREEVSSALEFLRPLEKPFPPAVEVRGCHELSVRWLPADVKSGFPVTYELHCNQGRVYRGDRTEHLLTQLGPATSYALRVRVCTEADTSPFSEAIVATTEEAAPSKPTNLRLLAATATQLKIAWDASLRGNVRTYLVFCDGRQVDCTTELTSIISGLTPCTEYNLQVCASSSKGKSERAGCQATTLDLGAHAPPKPQVTVLGRHEITVVWEPPEQPLGRINHYNVVLNGKKVAYSGTDMSCKVTSLTADTEYLITVVVVTNEGKAESRPARKRTARDEFDPQRQPLWIPNRRNSQIGNDPFGQQQPSLTDSENRPRRGSLAKLEAPRALQPLKTVEEQPPAPRRKSLPPPVDFKSLRDPPAPVAVKQQLSTLAPTTLVLDRFGTDLGQLRRVTTEEVRASVYVSGSGGGGGWPNQPQHHPQPLPPALLEEDIAESTEGISSRGGGGGGNSPAASAAAAPMLTLSQAPARANARSELEPLPLADREARQQQQQLRQLQQKRQRAKYSNRRSKESVWLQSKSLVSKLAKDSIDADTRSEELLPHGYQLDGRSSTDRFKTNLAILNSKSFAGNSENQQPQPQPQLPASVASNKNGGLLRFDRFNRERSLVPSKSAEFPVTRRPQKLD